MKKQVEQFVNECVAPPSLLDELRGKRAQIVREANMRTREIDRSINALMATEAEQVIARAREALNDV